MKIATLDKLLKAAAPLRLVLGEERYLIDYVRDELKNQLTPDEQSMNFGQYNMETTPISVALDDARSVPFFGDQRLVFITAPYFFTGEQSKNKLEHNFDDLLAYLENPTPSTQLVIFADYPKLDERKKITKQIKKQAQLIPVGKLDERKGLNLIQQQIDGDQIQIESAALKLLVSRTNADFSLMMANLPKLALYAGASGVITQTAVDDLVVQSLEDNVFDLMDSILKRKVTKALTQYKDLLLQKEEPIKLNAILATQFRLLLQVKILVDKGYAQGNLATALRVHPYRIKLAMQQAKQFPRSVLKQAYTGLIDAEYQMKTGEMDKQLVFELFMLKFTGNQLEVAK